MEFVPIEPAHFRRLVAIHIDALAGGFLPSLGPRFLEALYASMFASGAARGVVALDGRHVVGFCYFTADHTSFFRKTLCCRPLRLAVPAAAALIRNPRLIRRVVETIRYSGRAAVPGVQAEIFAWAVDPGWRGRRVGWQVLDAAEAMMQAEGIGCYKHTVYLDNERANDVYARRGHEFVGHFELYGRRWALYRVDFARRRMQR